MKVFIDTNIWLRFFLNDVPAQSQDCIKLFQKIEQGDYRPYTSAIVCLEAVYIYIRKALWCAKRCHMGIYRRNVGNTKSYDYRENIYAESDNIGKSK